MGRMRKLLIPGVDKTLLVKDATKAMPDFTRRRDEIGHLTSRVGNPTAAFQDSVKFRRQLRDASMT